MSDQELEIFDPENFLLWAESKNLNLEASEDELDTDTSVNHPTLLDWEDWSLQDLPVSVLSVTAKEEPATYESQPSTSSPDGDSSATVSRGKIDELLDGYGLDDEMLGDITLKKLKDLCQSSSSPDFKMLKSYRRTCLNRHYARSSRTKQLTKTNGLQSKLKDSEKEVERLKQDIAMKDATIRYLQLELEVMKSLNRE